MSAQEALASTLLGIDPELREQFVHERLGDLPFVERVLSETVAMSWRSHPAEFAHQLTGGEYRMWPYIQMMSRQVAAAFAGDDPRRILNVPSQYGKTSLIRWSILWALDHNPRLRVMYVSYDADKAVEEGGQCRDDADKYAESLRFRLRPDRRARGRWGTSEGGGLYCVGVNGSITGFPADAVFVDDVYKGWQWAHSPSTREHVWNIYRSQIRLRIQGPRCPIVVPGTRWHEDDLVGRLLAAAEADEVADQWSTTVLPALAEANDPLGREPGEPLEPDRFPLEEVLTRRAVLGSYLASALEQQHPTPEEGGEIKRAWFKLDDRMPEVGDDSLTSWDMKMTDRESGSYVVGIAMLRTGPDVWLVDLLRGQWDQATVANAIALMAVRHPHITRHVVEYTGNAPEVLKALRAPHEGYEVSEEMAGTLGMTLAERDAVAGRRQRGMGGLIKNPAKGSKEVRARAVVPYAEAGNNHLPASSLWTGGFLDELAAFPNGTNDDQVDAWSQGVAMLMKGGGPASMAKPSGRLQPSSRPGRSLTAARLGR